jgi:tetratricopeptide (TPR) repeat protein
MVEIAAALHKLATYRTHNNRASQETFSKGIIILKNNIANNIGEDGWAFLEQLALAAIDVGRLDVADRCLGLLIDRFPASQRVDCLRGIYIEATQSSEVALGYYQDILNQDSANAALWKRKISVLRRMGKVDRAVEELSQCLDTFYTDVEGWLELADLYSSCNQYTYALQSLSHVLLLAPQNPFYVLQAAETAYTAADIPLSIKMFLTTVDMTDADDSVALADSTPRGITVRAWYGVKLCTRRLLKEPRLSASPSQTPVPKNLTLIDELASERLAVAYSSSGTNGKIAEGRSELLAWAAAG